MTRKTAITAATLVLCLSSATLAQSDSTKKKSKPTSKPSNSETYTVHKSGEGGAGSPTFSTGGAKPNEQKPKAEAKSQPKATSKPAAKPESKKDAKKGG